jgi:tetratricopeptide (TPR) repeat protein
MTFWDSINGRATDLTPIRDPSVTKAMAVPLFEAAFGAAIAVGYAYAFTTGNLSLFQGAIGVRGGYLMGSEIVDEAGAALSVLEVSRRKVARSRIEQAIRYYERVLRAKPNDATILKRVSLSYAAKGDFQAAMASIDKALEIAQENHEAWLRKGTFCLTFGRGDLDGARKAFEKAAEFGPVDPESWSNLGLVYLQLGDRQKAKACWEHVTLLEPSDFSGWLNRGQLAYSLDLIEEGIAAWTRACELNSKLSPIWVTAYEAGYGKFSLGNVPEASAHYDEAIRLNPHYAEPWIGKALCAKRMGDLDHALKFLDEALRRDEENAKAWFIRGNFLSECNRAEEAEAAWKRAFSFDSTVRVPWVVAYDDGCQLFRSNQFHPAIASFSNAITRFPAYTEAWFKLGSTYRPLGATEHARKCWLEVLKQDPLHELTLMNLGNLEFEDGKRERAFELWDQAMASNPCLVQAAMNKGAALADIGELKEATRLFSKAAAADHPLGKQALDLCRLYDEMDPSVGPVA